MTQLHYTAWPDHGVPDNVMSIISFIRQVRKLFPATLDQPLLVHCSAGVGRTGTFITLDMLMQQMKAETTLSVCQCVINLRTQRMKMVQTLVCAWKIFTFNNLCYDICIDLTKLHCSSISHSAAGHSYPTCMYTTQAQYRFIHHALSELVVCGETEVTASSLRAFTDRLSDLMEDSGITGTQKHFQVSKIPLRYVCFILMIMLFQTLCVLTFLLLHQILEYLSSQYSCDITGGTMQENVNKNRYPNKLPSMFMFLKIYYPGDVDVE